MISTKIHYAPALLFRVSVVTQLDQALLLLQLQQGLLGDIKLIRLDLQVTLEKLQVHKWSWKSSDTTLQHSDTTL